MSVQSHERDFNGLLMSQIGLGTWAIGGADWGGTNEGDAIDAIHASIHEGITLIDTAPIYGFGLAEEIVGKAIAGHRDEVLLATKCGLVWNDSRGEFFFESDHGPVHRYLGSDSIRREVEDSLRRLRTDRIDLYQTHFQERTTPVCQVMETLLQLRQEGKIRAIGVSNADPHRLNEYTRHGVIHTVQEVYNMIDRQHAAEYLPWCKHVGVGVIAYSPLAMGLLTGKCTSSRSFASGDVRRGNKRFSGTSLDQVNALLGTLEPIADRRGATIAQIVIAWTRQQPFVSHVLCGARNPRQARENAAAGSIELDAQELSFISDQVAGANLRIPKVYE